MLSRFVALSVSLIPKASPSQVEFRGQERLSWKYKIGIKPTGAPVEVTVLRTPEPPAPEPAEGGAGVEISLEPAQAEEVKVTLELAPAPRLLSRVHELDYISTYGEACNGRLGL